jgi:hypothetical protein
MYFNKWIDGFKNIEMLDGNPGMPGSVYKITIVNGGQKAT